MASSAARSFFTLGSDATHSRHLAPLLLLLNDVRAFGNSALVARTPRSSSQWHAWFRVGFRVYSDDACPVFDVDAPVFLAQNTALLY